MNVVQGMSRNELRGKILDLGIAPAAYMPSKLCRNAFHYSSMRDVVPHLQKAIGVIGNTAQNISILKPHPEAAFFDHSFSSPTFEQEIKRNIQNYTRGAYD
ncbi:MAG: hypothetical protein KFB93_01540 [Simkaniaceae bacterium]|nr:MAG: hypothetical protein KFB93_01540 [Simkaniaceae bacterium]